MVNIGHNMKGSGASYGFEEITTLGRDLEEGFVLTVEPGIYFIPLLIDTWKQKGTCAEYINFDKLDAYRSFGGIRIEEDYLITESGSRLLGKTLAKSIADVEAIRNS